MYRTYSETSDENYFTVISLIKNLSLVYKVDTLKAGRAELCKSFFRKSVLNEHCLHYLLPVRPYPVRMLPTHYDISQNLHL